jgi:hypothetical protein
MAQTTLLTGDLAKCEPKTLRYPSGPRPAELVGRLAGGLPGGPRTSNGKISEIISQNTGPSVTRARVSPVVPAMSSARRPTRSSSRTAMTVKTTLASALRCGGQYPPHTFADNLVDQGVVWRGNLRSNYCEHGHAFPADAANVGLPDDHLSITRGGSLPESDPQVLRIALDGCRSP